MHSESLKSKHIQHVPLYTSHHDYIIVGAGPSGLTLAWFLAKKNYRCLIIESESYIGGCHGVHRYCGLFSEHSPKIYCDNYKMFKYILHDMGIK